MDTGLAWIDDQAQTLASLAQTIWEYAETGLEEQQSSEALMQFLKKEGFEVQSGIGGLPTAFVASYGAGNPTIGFLGEYDALPGLSQKAAPYQEAARPGGAGHGCGHNLLGVGSLAAAVALKRTMEAVGVRGTVRYYGCPAEEIALGKVFMARAGAFDDLDAALTWHPDALNMVNNAQSLALNSVRFAFHGRSAHASGAPHLGISALDAVELMNTGVNYLREHVTPDTRIHYVTTNGGSEPNVVPAFAEVWYYIRAPQRENVEAVYQRIKRIAEGACMMTGATLEIKFQTGLYEALSNPVLVNLLDESLRKVGAPVFGDTEKEFADSLAESFAPGQKGAVLQVYHVSAGTVDGNLHEAVAPDHLAGVLLPGSTDVGDVSWIVPTAQIMTACYVLGTMPHSWQAVAAAGSGIGHQGMFTAARALAIAGYRLMSDTALLDQVRSAFDQARGGKVYRSPLPDDLQPPI